MGLNDSYQVVRSNILMSSPLPTVSQANSIVLQQEQQREIKNVANPLEVDSSAFLVHQRQQSFPNRSLNHPTMHPTVPSSQGSHHGPNHIGLQPPTYSQPFHNNPGGIRSNVQCKYCRKPGHTIEKCYKLQRMRGQGDKGRRLAASVQQSDSGMPFIESSSVQPTGHHTLTSEQYEQLIALLSKQNMEVTPNLENQ